MVAILAACTLVTACADDDSAGGLDDSRLPQDPSQWVCQDSLDVVTQADIDAWCDEHPDRGSPLPEVLRAPAPLADHDAKNLYDAELEAFLKTDAYRLVLGWVGDRNWRFTGPYVGEIGSGYGYGTHLPVRIYYSPEVVDWLCDGRQGELPAGAAIIKEMNLIGDRLDVSVDDDGCMTINAEPLPLAWATMIKSGAESNDEWYWSIMQRSQFPLYAEERIDPPVVDRSAFPSLSFVEVDPSEPNPLWYPTGYFNEDQDKIPNVIAPQTQYGAFCLSCHSSAAVDYTFASLDNVIGEGIRYKWFPDTEQVADAGLQTHVLAYSDDASAENPFPRPLATPAPAFVSFFDQLPPVSFESVWRSRLPAETYDHVLAAPGGSDSFLTSDQCSGCHDAIKYLADVTNMAVEAERGGTTQRINLSPYGEWNVSPMGLAGRDPIFFAQLESETNHFPDLAACIENTCLHCHGVMGQRQHAIDTAAEDDACRDFFGVAPPAEVPFGSPFRLSAVTQWPGALDHGEQRYGALARDGISCTVCHRIDEPALGDESSFTGNFVTGPPTEVYGPYEDVVTVAMENALGVTPGFGRQSVDSDLCGSCHNILLPVLDNDGNPSGFRYEQTTHLEWLNSNYAPGRSRQQSCQDCHMPNNFEGEPLSFQIANFESSEFPPTTFRLPDEEIDMVERDRFARHSLHGLNVFLNQMFQQFPLLLGFRQAERYTRTSLDYPPLRLGQESMVDMAQEQTASVEVVSVERNAGTDALDAVVRITNRTGHFLPSGVGFRRVFVEFLVRDASGEILWASGRTNALGALVAGRTDRVLSTEQPTRFPGEGFQPHYQVITAEDQVQIYEEIVADSAGDRTTSFLRRFKELKDNRLRPDGYAPRFYESYQSPHIRELANTIGAAADDPRYVDEKLTGVDEIVYRVLLDGGDADRAAAVEVSLYHQAIPPPYLQERFADAAVGTAQSENIDRLYYMTSHLAVDDIVDGKGRQIMQQWKLFLASDTAAVPPPTDQDLPPGP